MLRHTPPCGHLSPAANVSSFGVLSQKSVRQSLHQVVHRVPRKFIFIPYGTKAIRQEVWLSNPNTELVYTEYIELSRHKRER